MPSLTCIVDGDPREQAFHVYVAFDSTIFELKEAIYMKTPEFRDLAPRHLHLWKTNHQPLHDEPITLAYIRSSACNDLIQKLSPLDTIEECWTADLDPKRFHVMVVPSTLRPVISLIDGAPKRSSSPGDSLGSAKAEELPSSPIKKFQTEMDSAAANFWAKWWGRSSYERQPVIKIHQIERDGTYPELTLPEHCGTMDGHEYIPDVSKVLIRPEYTKAYEEAKRRWSLGPQSGIIIDGEAGVGKTMFLYYVLALRLSESKPTAFQRSSGTVLLFTKDGVQKIPASTDWSDMLGVVEVGTWALFDSSQMVKIPGEVLGAHGSPFFVVQASSAYGSGWEWTRDKGVFAKFVMKPWTLEEIIIGRELQAGVTPSEMEVADFYHHYRSSARDAYQAGSPEKRDVFLSSLKGYRL